MVELGPRMNFATAYSTNIVAICQTCGLEKVTRIERSRRYLLPSGVDKGRFIREHHDRMTECLYDQPLQTFETGILPEPVFEIPLLEKGPDALLEIPGLAMDEWDRKLYHEYFVKEERRNPTIVEIRDLDNANSEHSRHGYFKGKTDDRRGRDAGDADGYREIDFKSESVEQHHRVQGQFERDERI